jgi:hypothetical protein
MDELKQILREIANEFTAKRVEFINSPNLRFWLKFGTYAAQGTKRAVIGAHHYQNGFVLHLDSLYQYFTQISFSFQAVERLYAYISNNNLWHDTMFPFKGQTTAMPSEVARVYGGFLCRNFEINNYEFLITENSFEQAYNELQSYFQRDYILYDHYFHLKGLGGTEEEVILNEEVSIVRAGHEMAKFFSINYTLPNYGDVEVYEDDYLLKISFKILKKDYNNANRAKLYSHKDYIIDKWKNFIILTVPDMVMLGKEIKLSTDWVLEYNFAPGPYGIEKRFWGNPKNVLTSELAITMQNYAHSFMNIKPIKNLDKKILYSLSRLKKSKESSSIDDRVVDLAIAFEYLINTSGMDITLQLCLKLIKLLPNKDSKDEAFNKLKSFYNLRSKVIHGNDTLNNDEKNLLIVNYAEKAIRLATFRLIELNQKYTYEEIDKQLKRTLYRPETIDELLKNPGVN